MDEITPESRQDTPAHLNAILIRITDGFSSDLREFVADGGNPVDIRKALRAFIDVLEDIYKHL